MPASAAGEQRGQADQLRADDHWPAEWGQFLEVDHRLQRAGGEDSQGPIAGQQPCVARALAHASGDQGALRVDCRGTAPGQSPGYGLPARSPPPSAPCGCRPQRRRPARPSASHRPGRRARGRTRASRTVDGRNGGARPRPPARAPAPHPRHPAPAQSHGRAQASGPTADDGDIYREWLSHALGRPRAVRTRTSQSAPRVPHRNRSPGSGPCPRASGA